MEYNGYLIKVNDYRNSKHKNCDFIFHNLNDCDEPIGTGESIADCKKQINEIIFERVHLDNFNRTVTLTVKHISHTESVLINSAGHTFTFNPDKHEGLADFIGSGD